MSRKGTTPDGLRRALQRSMRKGKNDSDAPLRDAAALAALLKKWFPADPYAVARAVVARLEVAQAATKLGIAADALAAGLEHGHVAALAGVLQTYWGDDAKRIAALAVRNLRPAPAERQLPLFQGGAK